MKTPILVALLLVLVSSAMPAQCQYIHTYAGTGVFGYNGDSIAANAAQLNYPAGIVLTTTKTSISAM